MVEPKPIHIRPLKVLYSIVLEEAEERGFGIYGICEFIDRLARKGVITSLEFHKMTTDIYQNKPDNVLRSGYFWGTGCFFTSDRIKFIKGRIEALSNA